MFSQARNDGQLKVHVKGISLAGVARAHDLVAGHHVRGKVTLEVLGACKWTETCENREGPGFRAFARIKLLSEWHEHLIPAGTDAAQERSRAWLAADILRSHTSTRRHWRCASR